MFNPCSTKFKKWSDNIMDTCEFYSNKFFLVSDSLPPISLFLSLSLSSIPPESKLSPFVLFWEALILLLLENYP